MFVNGFNAQQFCVEVSVDIFLYTYRQIVKSNTSFHLSHFSPSLVWHLTHINLLTPNVNYS